MARNEVFNDVMAGLAEAMAHTKGVPTPGMVVHQGKPLTTPRLALARDMMRCAVLEIGIRRELEAISLRIYAMTDEQFEEQFIEMTELRTHAYARKNG